MDILIRLSVRVMTQSHEHIMYNNNVRGMDGRGWGGVGDGLPMVSRVSH